MTRCSSHPFAKSLLAFSLSAVFSSTAFAALEDVVIHDSEVEVKVQESGQADGVIIDEANLVDLSNNRFNALDVTADCIHSLEVKSAQSVKIANNVFSIMNPEVIPEEDAYENGHRTGHVDGIWVHFGKEIEITGNSFDVSDVVASDIYPIHVDEGENIKITRNDISITTVKEGSGETIYLAGIYVGDGSQIEISDNKLLLRGAKEFISGIDVRDSENVTITRNDIAISTAREGDDEWIALDGIYVKKGSQIEISDNKLRLQGVQDDDMYGVHVSEGENIQVQITRNDITLSEIYGESIDSNGIYVENGGQIEISDNKLLLQEVEDDIYGIQVRDGENILISGNDISIENGDDISAEGISVLNGKNVAIANNTISVSNAMESSLLDLILMDNKDPESWHTLNKVETVQINGNGIFVEHSNLYDLNGINVQWAKQSEILGNILSFDDIQVRSNFRPIYVDEGENIRIVGNQILVKNSYIEDFKAITVGWVTRTEILDNILSFDGIQEDYWFRPIHVDEGENIKIIGNQISVKNSDIEDFKAITADTGDFDKGQLLIAGNKISLDNNHWGGFGSSITPSQQVTYQDRVKFIDAEVQGQVVIRDNTLEFVNNRITDNKGLKQLFGVSVSGSNPVSHLEISNNTLLVKNSDVKQVSTILFEDEELAHVPFEFNNNQIILDNSRVSDIVTSFSFDEELESVGLYEKHRDGKHQGLGKIVFRGRNDVGELGNFSTLQFDIGTVTPNNDPMLSLGTALSLDGETVIINTVGAPTPAEDVKLIDADVTMKNVTLQTAGTFATKSMLFTTTSASDSLILGDFYNELMAQKSVLSDSTLTLSDSQLATIALTRQSSEEALNLLQSTENLSVDAPMKGFASLSGSSNFYELGTGFDLNGTSLTVGGALRINDKWSGVGFANFSDANADSTVSGFRGDSDMKTYSAGVALRYQTEMPFYTEGALVVGQADTDFVGSYTNDTARYDSKRFYTTAQLGVGSDFALSDNVNLNLYGRYSFTYLDGDKVSLNNAYNDTFDVDDTMVHAMRVGARVKGSVAPNVQWFAGAAFERVLDGDVEAMVKDAKLKTETLKGNVGIFEVGATLAPNDLGPWTMDVKAGAYAGDRRGISGSVNFNYVF